MNKIFVFDIDGTLTPARKPIEPEFAAYFNRFCKFNDVYLCTGSDWTKVREQIPERILSNVKGVFTCSGNSYWFGKFLMGREDFSLRKEFSPPISLLKDLEKFVSASKCPKKTSLHIETRVGMLNFSTVGRNCSDLERKEYAAWDGETGERKKIVDFLSNKYPELSFNIGGEISIDIHPKGWDKSHAIKTIKTWNPKSNIYFFGDRIREGGNDMPAAMALGPLDRAYPVEGPQETQKILETMFSASC